MSNEQRHHGAGMAKVNLGDLSDALLHTANKTQDALDRHRARGLTKFIEVDESGQPKELVWQCHLPLVNGDDHRYEVLRIPWAEFCSGDSDMLAEVSVDFDCEIQVKKHPDNSEANEYTIIPLTARKHGHNNGQQHHFKMTVKQSPDSLPEVSVDGITIDDFIEQNNDKLIGHRSGWRRHLKKCCVGLAVLIILSVFVASVR